MRSIVRGIVALFAAFCMMDAVQAAPTIVSPVDYSTVQTLTDSMKNLISPLNSDVSIFKSANTTARENYETEYFYNNSVPATLSWSGTTGDCTVKVWRTNGGSESAPFFSETVSGTSTECYNLEVGCNYTWKVTDSQGNSAVGHFFTEDQAPRIIRGRRSNFTYSGGADCSNGRDIGGWATADGKRVKQGKIYRSGQLEYCSFQEGSETYQKMDMLYDVLGIRVDIDLRTVENVNYYADWKAEWDTGSDNVCKWSGIGPDVERFTIEWETLGKGPSEGNPYVYDGKYGCQFPSYSGFYNSMSIDYKVGDTTKTYTQTAAQNKIAVWAAFNRIYQAVVVDKEPVIFHCSHGKDRTGSLALVIHGLLGVSEANIKRDFATAWFCNPDYTFTQTSMNNMITGLKNLDTASTKTLAGGCEEYLISCATAAGDNAGATKVAAFKTAMLEEPETAAEAPLDDIGTAEEGDWGYRKTIGNEVAIVFTNHTKTVNWIVPEKLENVKFLVVGGGGGGGADNSNDSNERVAGAGGGGGGVITGLVNFDKDTVVSITVGAGGLGGNVGVDASGDSGFGGAYNGEPSSFGVDDTAWVVAYGGGSDQGATAGNSYYGGKNGGSGGSGAGGRAYANGGAATQGSVNSANVTRSEKNGFPGGNGCTVEYGSYGYGAAAGGGGATAAGGDGTKPDGYKGGDGGAGLTSDITGTATVYGSGGGGSSTWGEAGVGGEGAGDGVIGNNGENALANQGGGGGGSSRKAAVGGNGGSGIVVLRYSIATDGAIAAPVIATKVYTGETLTADVESSEGYTVTKNDGGTDVGTYDVVLKLNEGYTWADLEGDDASADRTLDFEIVKAQNVWKTTPSISSASWMTGTAAGTLTEGETAFGEVTATIAKDGGAASEFNGNELPTEVGSYVIVYTAPAGTSNYDAPAETTKTVSFTITEYVEYVPPVTNAMSTASWGYTVSGLGDNRNEVAVVFTNHTETMTWTVPENLENVQFLVVGGGGGAGGAASWNKTTGQYNRGGAGGGGGGVVTGLVDFVSGSIVSVTVGKGGEGGVRVNNTTNGTAAAKSAGARSSFSIGETSYVIARGGGRDLGLGKSGGYGGSNAGSRKNTRQEKFSWVDTDVNTTYITTYEKLGNYGGKAYAATGTDVRAGAGGGGATEEGYSCTDASNAAKGGKGLTSDITGVSAVYGSGGGGGSGYAGTGASGGSVEAGAGGGSSKDTTPNNGGDGLANYGGGGGGAGREGNGGNGGSGIVVFRYTTTAPVEPPVDPEPELTVVNIPVANTELVYTGEELTGVEGGEGYTLTDNTATDAGTYEATATLAEGYKWSDDTTEPKTISWSIAKATNEWTTEPSISLESWTQGETAGVLTAGVAKFGEVTSSMAEFPTAVGKYTITYTVVETDNYSGLTKEVSFEILKKATSYDFTVGDVALTDGKLTFKGNFAIDGESEVAKMNLVVSVYDVAEGGDALKTVTVEDISAGEFNQEIDIAELELADGVYYFAFEVQDEAGNVLVAAEERSMLTIGETKAVKPTVNYASGTKFTVINGVVQKPVVTPADGNGYTVSYEGDFTAAGTHRIVIALKDGWTWSDGTSDTLTYEYEFIERTYTEYYIKTFKTSGTDVGTFQSEDRWFTDPKFTTGSKMSTCPNVYEAHNIPSISANAQLTLLIDNEEGKELTPKFGKFTVNGNFRIVTYSGGLKFQNDTATPMPIWEVESGVSTIDGVVFDVNGSGTGYIDIGANTTNVLGGVNYNVNYDNGFESSKKLFVRFSDEATAGSALRVHDFENWYATNFGWFEGGAEGSTYALDIEEGVLNLNNPDAVSGVAGDLAITVKLGDKVGAADAYLNVAGTLNINEGSTLAVDANSMPCGVYTIINAATFNGADLLTSAAGATVTGLAEFTSGELVREGNKIVLYIETTIPPRVPGIEGDSVATNKVFETARVAKPIWYKTKPAINGDEITFNRVTVKVPEYYDVTLETLADGYKVNLKLKDNLKAFIANKVENDQIVTPAIRLENEKVYIHLENTKSDLYYTLLKSTKLGAEADWQPTEDYAIGKADFEYTPAEGEAETCFFMAGDVMDEPPAK